MTILADKDCTAITEAYDKKIHICVSANSGESFNAYDYGAPLVIDMNGVKTAIGIASFTFGIRYPMFFTRIEHYLPWIQSKADIMEPMIHPRPNLFGK